MILYGQETAVVVHLTFLVALAIVGGARGAAPPLEADE